MSDTQRYTGNNHVIGPGVHIAVGNDPLTIVYGGKLYFFEWHYYCGPTVLSRKTQDPLTKQPGERSPFWRIAVWWKDQGCRVVDGVAQWDEPPKVTRRFRRQRRRLVQDDRGPVKLQFWKGYETMGPVDGTRVHDDNAGPLIAIQGAA